VLADRSRHAGRIDRESDREIKERGSTFSGDRSNPSRELGAFAAITLSRVYYPPLYPSLSDRPAAKIYRRFRLSSRYQVQQRPFDRSHVVAPDYPRLVLLFSVTLSIARCVACVRNAAPLLLHVIRLYLTPRIVPPSLYFFSLSLSLSPSLSLNCRSCSSRSSLPLASSDRAIFLPALRGPLSSGYRCRSRSIEFSSPRGCIERRSN